MVANFFTDYGNHFDIIDMMPEVAVQNSKYIQSYFILKPKLSGNFTPLKINIKSIKLIQGKIQTEAIPALTE